jgi:hypothetical protein
MKYTSLDIVILSRFDIRTFSILIFKLEKLIKNSFCFLAELIPVNNYYLGELT